MKSFPLSFNAFANKSVTSSYAETSSFAQPTVVTASLTLIPSGSKGNKGTNGGAIYLLSSSVAICLGGTTTTTSTSTTTTSTTTSTTTTTTLPPTGVYCLNGDSGPGCLFYEGFLTCPSGDPCDPFATTTTTTQPTNGGGSEGCRSFLCNGGLGTDCGPACYCVGGSESPGDTGYCVPTNIS